MIHNVVGTHCQMPSSVPKYAKSKNFCESRRRAHVPSLSHLSRWFEEQTLGSITTYQIVSRTCLSCMPRFFRYAAMLERTCRTVGLETFQLMKHTPASASCSQPFLNWSNIIITEYGWCFHTLGSLSWMSGGRVPEAHLCVSNCLLSRSLRQKATRQMLSGWRRRSLRSCARGNGAKRCCHLRELMRMMKYRRIVFICFSPPARWGSLDLFSSSPPRPQPQAPEISGHCRTSTASSRAQWALPDLSQTPETMSDRTPERSSERMSKQMPERMPEWMPEKMPDRMSE